MGAPDFPRYRTPSNPSPFRSVSFVARVFARKLFFGPSSPVLTNSRLRRPGRSTPSLNTIRKIDPLHSVECSIKRICCIVCSPSTCPKTPLALIHAYAAPDLFRSSSDRPPGPPPLSRRSFRLAHLVFRLVFSPTSFDSLACLRQILVIRPPPCSPRQQSSFSFFLLFMAFDWALGPPTGTRFWGPLRRYVLLAAIIRDYPLPRRIPLIANGASCMRQ